MSIDYTVICDKCKLYKHLGQHMGGIVSFGYGNKDEEGRKDSAEFIANHIFHNDEFLKIVLTDDIPTEYMDIESK